MSRAEGWAMLLPAARGCSCSPARAQSTRTGRCWGTPGLGHPTQSEQAEKLPSAPWPRHQGPRAGKAEGDHLHWFLAT